MNESQIEHLLQLTGAAAGRALPATGRRRNDPPFRDHLNPSTPTTQPPRQKAPRSTERPVPSQIDDHFGSEEQKKLKRPDSNDIVSTHSENSTAFPIDAQASNKPEVDSAANEESKLDSPTLPNVTVDSTDVTGGASLNSDLEGSATSETAAFDELPLKSQLDVTVAQLITDVEVLSEAPAPAGNTSGLPSAEPISSDVLLSKPNAGETTHHLVDANKGLIEPPVEVTNSYNSSHDVVNSPRTSSGVANQVAGAEDSISAIGEKHGESNDRRDVDDQGLPSDAIGNSTNAATSEAIQAGSTVLAVGNADQRGGQDAVKKSVNVESHGQVREVDADSPSEFESDATSNRTFDVQSMSAAAKAPIANMAATESANSSTADDSVGADEKRGVTPRQVSNRSEGLIAQLSRMQRSGVASRSAPIDETHGPAHIDPARFVSRVAKAFQVAGERGGSMQLRLSPPELGSLRLEMAVREGVLTASLEAETPVARRLLLDHLPMLRDRLAEQNIRVERFDVDVRREGAGGNSGGAAQQQQHGDHPPKHSAVEHRTERRATGGEVLTTPRVFLTSQPSTGINLVA